MTCTCPRGSFEHRIECPEYEPPLTNLERKELRRLLVQQPRMEASSSSDVGGTVYQVWYWDPCNGMNGHSENRGLFKSREAAQAFIDERVNNWDRDAYRISEIEIKIK